MKDADLQELIQSVRQAGKIHRGEQEPGRALAAGIGNGTADSSWGRVRFGERVGHDDD